MMSGGKDIFKISAIAIMVLVLNCNSLHSQNKFFTKSDTLNSKRVKYLMAGELGVYVVLLTGLNQMWYVNYDRSAFHFYDDSKGWLQHDKVCHSFNSYYLTNIATNGFRWAGMKKKKSAIFGAGLGLLYVSSIELLDGFSAKWGASASDLVANTLGSTLYLSQELLWQEQRIIPKYSYTKSEFNKYRPNEFGQGFEQYFKDYNAITIWLSANIASFTKGEKFPKWLNIAFGYGADGMIGSEANPAKIGDVIIPQDIVRRRQFYFSFDIDLRKIKTRSKILQTTFNIINVIKFPFPGLEFSNGDVKYHWIAY